jgi:hypothetical protein
MIKITINCDNITLIITLITVSEFFVREFSYRLYQSQMDKPCFIDQIYNL